MDRVVANGLGQKEERLRIERPSSLLEQQRKLAVPGTDCELGSFRGLPAGRFAGSFISVG